MGLFDSLFGGNSIKVKAPDPNKAVVNLNAGGLKSTFQNGTVNLTSSPQRQGLVTGLQSTFNKQADEIGALRETVKPGFGDLSKARLAGIEDAQRRSTQDLRGRLAQRRVLGSSIAANDIARTNIEFERAKDLSRAESFLAELDTTISLIGQEYEARASAFGVALQDLNLQAELGASIQAQTQQLFADAQKLEMEAALANAELEAQSQAGFGKLLGTIAGGVAGFALGGPAGALAGASIGGGGGGNINLGGIGGGSSTPTAQSAFTATA